MAKLITKVSGGRQGATLLTNTATKDITPANGDSFTLNELYKYIGTDMIQVIGLGNGKIMIMDEDGKMKGKAVNPAATAAASKVIASSDCIVGNVVVCKVSQLK